MIIEFEKEVCKYLNIPSIPKKEWDGEKKFVSAVGVLNHIDGSQSYAVVKYDSETGKAKVNKTFLDNIPWTELKKIFIVPQYMENVNLEETDLDSESKQSMKMLMQEAKELEDEKVDDKIEMPKHDYYFQNIHNDDEARAFIIAYNKRKKIKGRIPKDHQGLLMRLSVIWMEEQQNA